jgi:hypothetical protein
MPPTILVSPRKRGSMGPRGRHGRTPDWMALRLGGGNRSSRRYRHPPEQAQGVAQVGGRQGPQDVRRRPLSGDYLDPGPAPLAPHDPSFPAKAGIHGFGRTAWPGAGLDGPPPPRGKSEFLEFRHPPEQAQGVAFFGTSTVPHTSAEGSQKSSPSLPNGEDFGPPQGRSHPVRPRWQSGRGTKEKAKCSTSRRNPSTGPAAS